MCKSCMGIVGGTGSPPLHQLFGSISRNLPYTTVEFCKPTPGFRFLQNEVPPRHECGIYTRDLDAYPLNQPTYLDQGYYTFGDSEMALVYVRIDNYPMFSGPATIKFFRPDGSLIFQTSHSLPVPDPGWTWWYAFFWGVIGKFDDTFVPSDGNIKNEIVSPGTYKAEVITDWGTSVIDYEVTAAPPISMPVTFECVGPGTMFILKNDELVGNAFAGLPKTIEYRIGDIIGFQAYPDAGASLVSVCDFPQTECRTELQYRYDVIGQLPQKMIATFQAGCIDYMWVCEDPANGYEVNGCGTRRQAARCEPGPEPGVTTLTADKGSYDASETPIFTVRYSPDWIGKEIILSKQEATGEYISVATATANSTGITTLNYKPVNSGNHTFVAQITPCAIFLNCSTSNKLTISITGDLPCNPLDPLCSSLGKIDLMKLASIGAGVYLLGQLIGGKR